MLGIFLFAFYYSEECGSYLRRKEKQSSPEMIRLFFFNDPQANNAGIQISRVKVI